MNAHGNKTFIMKRFWSMWYIYTQQILLSHNEKRTYSQEDERNWKSPESGTGCVMFSLIGAG